jgi:polysaccharide chain length determinant protein (PEP-CTERM system associated)
MLFHRKLALEEYLVILKRRWWIILIPAIIMPIVMYGVTYLVTPQYVSSSLVLVNQQKVPTDFVKSLATEALDTRLAYITETITSRNSILPIIDRYNLYGDQHLSPDARIDLVTKKALHIEAVQSALAAANGLPGFRISFTYSDPHTAQQVCAEITSLFTKKNIDFRDNQAADTTSFIQRQLDDAKHTLDDQDKKIADFQRQYFGMLPEDQGSNQNIISSLSSRLEATTQSVNTLEGNKAGGEQMLALQAQNTPASITAQKAPAEHQEELERLEAQESDLTAHYQPDYPDVKEVKRKIADLKAQMARDAAAPQATGPSFSAPHVDSPATIQLRGQLHNIDVQLAQKQKEQDDLKRQISMYTSKIESSPEVEEQYKLLTRDYQTDQADYDKLSVQMKQAQATTDLEQAQEGESFQMYDEANLPSEPIFPKVPVFIFGGLAVGIAFGVAIIALLEYKDTALRNEREIWDFTHLPTLAIIAWSGETATAGEQPVGFWKRLFRRKPGNDELAGAQG